MGVANIAWPRNNRNCNQPRYFAPLAPAVELRQIVRAHQPDEAVLRVAAAKGAEGVYRVSGAELPLDAGDADRRRVRSCQRRAVAAFKRRHPLRFLQRITGGDEPPHLVHPERLQRVEADPSMSAMGRIEGAAKEADRRHAPPLAGPPRSCEPSRRR
jgi:hypothetical protein